MTRDAKLAAGKFKAITQAQLAAAASAPNNKKAATKKGGVLLLDDMQRNHQTRRAFDEVVASGKLATPTCQENVNIAVSHIHRRDTTSVKTLSMDWCTATVI